MDGVAILFKNIFQLIFILGPLARNACCLATFISLNFARGGVTEGIFEL